MKILTSAHFKTLVCLFACVCVCVSINLFVCPYLKRKSTCYVVLLFWPMKNKNNSFEALVYLVK